LTRTSTTSATSDNGSNSGDIQVTADVMARMPAATDTATVRT